MRMSMPTCVSPFPNCIFIEKTIDSHLAESRDQGCSSLRASPPSGHMLHSSTPASSPGHRREFNPPSGLGFPPVCVHSFVCVCVCLVLCKFIMWSFVWPRSQSRHAQFHRHMDQSCRPFKPPSLCSSTLPTPQAWPLGMCPPFPNSVIQLQIWCTSFHSKMLHRWMHSVCSLPGLTFFPSAEV